MKKFLACMFLTTTLYAEPLIDFTNVPDIINTGLTYLMEAQYQEAPEGAGITFSLVIAEQTEFIHLEFEAVPGSELQTISGNVLIPDFVAHYESLNVPPIVFENLKQLPAVFNIVLHHEGNILANDVVLVPVDWDATPMLTELVAQAVSGFGAGAVLEKTIQMMLEE